MSRRALLLGASSSVLATACARACAGNRAESTPTIPEPPFIPTPAPMLDAGADAPLDPGELHGSVRLQRWSLGVGDGGPAEVVVLVPEGPKDARYPVVFALHGRGEAVKEPKEGAMGWPRDYALLQAIERIQKPPITDKDYQGLSEPVRLGQINAALAARAYAGLIVVCPYMPDIDLRKDAPQRSYGRFLLDTLLPLVRERTPARATAEATGIDGVSLGGAIAMFVGFENPQAFGCVGGLQPAIQAADGGLWASRAAKAREKNPKLGIRLLTSTKDYFRDGIYEASRGMRRLNVAHTFLDVPGPHDYIFNRGPGAYELLFQQERVLAGR